MTDANRIPPLVRIRDLAPAWYEQDPMFVFGRLKGQVEARGESWDEYVAAALIRARERLVKGTEPFWWGFFDVMLMEHENGFGCFDEADERGGEDWVSILTGTIALAFSDEMTESLSHDFFDSVKAGFITPKDAEDAKSAAWHCATDAVSKRMAQARRDPLAFLLSIGFYSADIDEAYAAACASGKIESDEFKNYLQMVVRGHEAGALVESSGESIAAGEPETPMSVKEKTIEEYVAAETAEVTAALDEQLPNRKKAAAAPTRKNKLGAGRPSTRPTGPDAIRAMRTRLAMEGLKSFGLSDKDIGEAFSPPMSRAVVNNIINDNGKSSLSGSERERQTILALAMKRLAVLQSLIDELNSSSADTGAKDDDEILEDEVIDGLEDEILEDEILED